MPTVTGLPLCHEYIYRGGSCQEHRGIIFLMAIPVALCLRNSGSQTPDRWLKLARNTHAVARIERFVRTDVGVCATGREGVASGSVRGTLSGRALLTTSSLRICFQ